MNVKDDKLTCALNSFVDEMDSRLAEKEADGYSGWDDESYSTQIAIDMHNDVLSLEQDFFGVQNKDVAKRKCVDIANRAMMLWYQLEGGKNENKS